MHRIPNVTNLSERVPSLSSINLTDENSFIALGAEGDIRLTRATDGQSLNLSNQVTSDDNPSILTLQSNESVVETGETIGSINFQAKGESSASDSVLVCAGIEAIAENDFTASSNATKFSFKLGSSGVAKMSLSSAGVLTATTFVGDLTGDVTGDVTGNADTATALETTRTIGGVSFNGTADINLPGVNTAGNQNTSGNADTATLAATATTITVADESSDISCNVLFTTGATGNLPPKSGTNLLFNSSNGKLTATTFVGAVMGDVTGDVTGNADTATALETTRTIGGVSFNGTADINLPGVNTAGNQNTSGNADTATLAATATALETTRTIGGVSFNGSADINLPGVNATGNQNTSGNAETATLATTATNVTVSDESSDISCNVLFTTGATGNLPPKSGTNLTFNSSNGKLTATTFAGALIGDVTGDVTGNADTATLATTATVTANNSANETVYPVFVDYPATGSQGLESDTGLTYNPSSGVLTSTTFVGALTGTASAATLAVAATNVNVADESSDTTCNVLFATGPTGNLPPKSGTNITFNSSTGILSVTGLDVSGPIKRHTLAVTSSQSITADAHADVTMNLAAANPGTTAVDITLPAASGTGHHFKFIVSVVNSTSAGYGYKFIGGSSGDKFHGIVNAHNGNTLDVDPHKVTDHSTISFNGGSKGGLIGDIIEFIDMTSGIYNVNGTTSTPYRVDSVHPAS